jgi:hypothetical protein
MIYIMKKKVQYIWWLKVHDKFFYFNYVKPINILVYHQISQKKINYIDKSVKKKLISNTD